MAGEHFSPCHRFTITPDDSENAKWLTYHEKYGIIDASG